MSISFQTSLDALLDPFESCLTPEIASRIASIKAPDSLSERVQELAEKSSSNTLSEAEKHEYECIEVMTTKLSSLQAMARRVLKF